MLMISDISKNIERFVERHSQKCYLAMLFVAVFSLTLAVPMAMIGCLDPLVTEVAQSPAGLVITGPVIVTQGGTGQFQVQITNADGSPLSSEAQVTWSIVTGPGTISASGLYTPPANLTENAYVTVRATVQTSGGTFSAERDLIITPATRTIQSLTILGPDIVDINQQLSFAAQVTFDTGEVEDVTSEVGWSLTGPGTLDIGSYTAPDDFGSFVQITITAAYTVPGAIGLKDLQILATHYGTGSGMTRAMGDFNGDGEVDVSDLAILAANYNVSKVATKVVSRLNRLILNGPAVLPAGGKAAYTLTVVNSDSSTANVTAKTVWSIAGGPGDLSAGGTYTAPNEVNPGSTVTLKGQYSDGIVTKSTTKIVTLAGLAVSPDSLTFDPANETEKTISLTSVGSDKIDYMISGIPKWLRVPSNTGTATADGSEVSIFPGDLTTVTGEAEATMTITPKLGSITGTARTVTVTLLLAAIGASAESLTFAPGDTSGPMEIWNAGASTLNYTISSDVPWLTISPTIGSSTGEHVSHTVTIDRANLDITKAYTATITVKSTQSGVAAKTIPVTLTAKISPTANAGDDQTITDSDQNDSEQVTLDASGSTAPSGRIVSYRWTEGKGYYYKVLIESAGPKATITLDGTGVHTITLEITDNLGQTSTDTVDIALIQMRNSISQYGITWTFDKSYPCGKFVNGDWWVVGSVNLLNVTPAPTGSGTTYRNGSMVNPVTGTEQGYDGRVPNYTPNLSITFPHQLETNQSIVSAESIIDYSTCPKDMLGHTVDPSHSFIKTASVLTCLDFIPSPTAFRPAYVGTNKKLYDSSNLRLDLLPSLQNPGGTTTVIPPQDTSICTYYGRFWQRVWLNHKSGWEGIYEHPIENMAFYYREAYAIENDASLLLCCNFSDKMNLLIPFVQHGIDNYYTSLLGTGDREFTKWPILLAGILLNEPTMTSVSNPAFKTDAETYYGKGWYGATVLWMPDVTQRGEEYDPSVWATLNMDGVNGFKAEVYRRNMHSWNWVGQGLAARLMHAKSLWNHDAYFDYVDRWMTESDDTPFKGTTIWEYMKTYSEASGTDGYFPQYNHQGTTTGTFTTTMWKLYRKQCE